MIDDTLKKIEERVQGPRSIDDDKKRELTNLFKTLESEVVALSETEARRAESIAKFADLSSHEVAKEGMDARLQEISLDGLSASVDGFEASHPKLVEIVNSICNTLAGLGI